jgi:translocation and assembly module TamB
LDKRSEEAPVNDLTRNSESGLPRAIKRRRNLLWKITAWTLAAAATLVVLAVIAIAVLLHNERFHNYVLTTARQKASDSLGVRVQLQNFAVNLSHLDLDLYGITVDGAAPYANPPLLQVDHAEIGVRIVSILHGKWYLESFRVDRPIVRVFVDPKGVTNIPTIKSTANSNRNMTIFDLAIRRAVLDRGEVYYNDRQSPLTADLHDVEFQASFNSLLQKYSGKLSYSDAHLTSGTIDTIPHNLEAEFDATPTTFHLTQAKLSTGPSQLMLIATVQNYSNPYADVHYDAIVDGAQVSGILNNSSVPTGQVHATGALHYQHSANRPLLDSMVVNGDLSSSGLNVRTTSVRTRITGLAAHYSLENGDATLHDITMRLLGGKLTGSGAMTNVAGDSHSKVNASLHGLSLAELKGLAYSSASTRNVGIGGTLNADLAAAWGKNFDDLIAHADAKIDGRVQGSSPAAKATPLLKTKSGVAASTGLPLEGAIHGVYTAKDKQLTLKNSYIKTPETNLTMNGTVSDRSSLDLRLQADDLREVESIADLFRTPTPGQPLQPLGLAGTASFQGSVRGSIAVPHLTGEFLASNLHVNGSEWKVLRTNVEVSPSLVSLQHGDLEPASRGHITFNASAALTQWAFTDSSPVQLDLDASQLSVAALTSLAGQQIPVTGTLAANVKLHGTELNPIGNGSISVAGLVAYDQPVTSAKITFSGTGDEAHADLAVQLPSGNIRSNVSVRPKDKTYIAKLTGVGIRLEKLQALKAHKIDASGEVSLNASGQGSFDDPQLDATLQIPMLTVQKQTITGLNLRMIVANHVANATLLSSAINTTIQAKAKVDLTGDYLADASLDTQAIPLQPLLAIYVPEQSADVSGETEIHATLHGPLKDKNQLEAHVTIPTLKLAYGANVQLAAAAPIHVDYKNGIVDVQRSKIQGTDTDLQFQGSIPTSGNAPMSVMLLGTVNLQLAQLFDPEVRTSGELKFAINSNGGSDLGGKIDIVNASYSSEDVPVGLQNGNGTLTLTRDRLNITKFQGTVGGGTMTAQGGVALRPSIQFDLGLAVQGVRMLYPQGMREGVDANLRLAGTTDSAVLGGSISLTDLSFTSAFDLNSFISQFTGGVSSPPTPGFSQNLQLNLAVRSSSDINLVSRTLSIDGSANLQVRGTAANPVIIGRVNLNDGDIILNGDRFVLNGGTVEFVNPSETQPVLNVSLKTTIQQYDVYLRFNGPIDQLRTNYSSDPALPSADIINLLAFGKTTEADAANPSTPANQAAAGLVASQVSSQVTSRVSKVAGISQLSINPVLAGGTSQGPQGANITIQQRVTGNLFVTFSSNVASTQTQTIQGQYQLSPRVAVSATRDQNGGFAFDALIKKTW